MSYILEALKRAEQQRQRTPARLDPPSVITPVALTRRLDWRAGAAALALLLLGLALGWSRPWETPRAVLTPRQPVAPVVVAPPAPIKPAPLPPSLPPVRQVVLAAPVAPPPFAPSTPLAEPPPVRISMHNYSSVPGERLVMIDDRLLRQGEAVNPELLLREITPDGVVLVYQGRRYARGIR